MSLSVIVVESCSSLLAPAAGDSIASSPRNASAYAVFMLTLRLYLVEGELINKREVINRCDILRLNPRCFE